MEIFMLLVVIVLLVVILTGMNSKFSKINYTILDLQRTIEALKKSLSEKEQPIAKPETPPVIIPKPFEPKPIIPERIQPIPEPVNPIQEKEKVFETERDFTANPVVPKPELVREIPKPYVPKKSWWEDFKDKNPDLEKFIGENLINKIGVLILVLGISYFVKFAIDKDWINEPARAGIGILSGAFVVGFAHKLRKNYAAFSSVLVAGAIAIFYFTIGIAFHDYHLFNQTVAFIIMVVITAFSCLISLSYNRKELAVLSLIGGFAVPFMVSTGEGNYAVLFTYIIILDIGILALAYRRKWNIINILSYIFTVILYGGWLFTDLSKPAPHYFGALLFGFAFYFIFILINIINNLRTKGVFSVVELTILTSNTFLFYLAGMLILSSFHPEFRGLFTTVLALLNLSYAWFLYKKFGLDKTAVYLLIGLTLTFVTLAIPIQFQGNYITLFWAAEAVLLLWLGQKSGIVAYRFGSVVVHFLMVISLMMDWNNMYLGNSVLNIVANPIFITGTFSFLSMVAARYLLRNETENTGKFGFVFNPKNYSIYLTILAIALAYFTGLFETVYQSNDYIANTDSAAAFPILYHLLFATVLCHFLWKSNFNQLASGIVMANVVLFAFGFSNYTFSEHTNYITTGMYQRIAFYLHYASLLIVIYSAFRLYKENVKKPAFAFLHKSIFIWIAAFFIVFVASSELLLHGLVFSNAPVTNADIVASKINDYYKVNDPAYFRTLVADQKISDTRNQIIKTGFPILWGILAFIFLIVGIKKQNKSIRIIALSLLGITILKLFLFDIRNASETGKIIAFILLGILILIISFVYNKIKVLVLDNNKPDENKPVADENQ